ncbi:MAG: potassium channel protein [Candidatus Schekmanbacteria bacterium]|nr:potassium channel protein [Candidatus Schekmanbacteria bacterium]
MRRSFVLSLLGLAGVIVGGSAGYRYIEGWTWLESVWMVAITLTTIGYGEVHTLSESGRAFTLVIIVGGVSLGTYTVGRVTRMLLEGELASALKRRRSARRMKQLDKHYIVVGYGRLGRTVAEELRQSGAQVAVVERDPLIARAIEAELDVPVIVGDGANDETLIAAGVTRARGLAVTIPSAAEAVYVTLSARQLNPTLNILTRVDEADAMMKARRAGAAGVVSPHRMGGWRMAHGLVRPHASYFLDLATLAAYDEVMLDELVVPSASPLAGKSIAELPVGKGSGVLVVAIQRPSGDLLMVPGAQERIYADDVVIVIGSTAGVKRVGRLLSGDESLMNA